MEHPNHHTEAPLLTVGLKAQPAMCSGPSSFHFEAVHLSLRQHFQSSSAKMVPRTPTSGAKGLLQTYRKH